MMSENERKSSYSPLPETQPTETSGPQKVEIDQDQTDNETEESRDLGAAKADGTPDNTNNSQRMCEVCRETSSKYTCPRCEIRSCCLACVKEHKARLDCSGERNKTEFVPMDEYSDRHLLNDYRFLEDAGRTLYTNKVERQNRQSGVGVSLAPYHYNRRSKLLMTAANKRGVRLKILSSTMKRHRYNTSFYTINSDTIDWHIEWCFVASGCLVHHERVAEKDILIEVAQKYTNPINFQHLRRPLEVYRKEGLDNCTFLIKVDGLPANRPRYLQLNPLVSIAENLKGHCLVEHPTIFLMPQSFDKKDYPLLERDDFPFMDMPCLKHVKNNHPAFKGNDDLQTAVLDISSNIYTVDQ